MSKQRSSKKVLYYDQAERLYVEDGLSVESIHKRDDVKVSLKTLYNWKGEHDWDRKRRRFLDASSDMRDDLVQLARDAIKEARANMTPHSLYAVKHALAALKMINGIKLIEEDSTEAGAKGITADVIKQIEQELGLV